PSLSLNPVNRTVYAIPRYTLPTAIATLKGPGIPAAVNVMNPRLSGPMEYVPVTATPCEIPLMLLVSTTPVTLPIPSKVKLPTSPSSSPFPSLKAWNRNAYWPFRSAACVFGGAGPIVSEIVAVAMAPKLSVTVTPNMNVFAVAGNPNTWPAETFPEPVVVIVKPVGSAPLVTANVYGGVPPVTGMSAPYRTPTAPPGSVAEEK